VIDPDQLVLVSVDDHVIEPPDVFAGRLPAGLRDRAPRVVRVSDEEELWEFDGVRLPYIANNAIVDWPREEGGFEPTTYADLREGCYDVHARVRDMDAAGVLVSMCFPSFPGFSGRQFSTGADKELALAVLRAYNDWHVEAWCGAHPDRFIPLAVVPLWDSELLAEEVRRVAALGCRAVTFPENPAAVGCPSFHDEHWEPFWRACDDEGTVVCMHVGSGGGIVSSSPDAPVDEMIALLPFNSLFPASSLLWSPVLRRHPGLRFALSEGGIGWVPAFLERCDAVLTRHGPWTGQDFGGRRPSDVFREHFLLCFVEDDAGLELRHRIGTDAIAWECDYPHADSSWPDAAAPLARSMNALGVTGDEAEAITWRNAARTFGIDPFAGRARDDCTAGALQARATDVDTSIRSRGKPRHEIRTMAQVADYMNR
jgi:predicted TIM-barrel fold metal-dependent hydrolase